MAKRTRQVVLVTLAALCLAGIATSCAVKVPTSDFPTGTLLSPAEHAEHLK